MNIYQLDGDNSIIEKHTSINTIKRNGGNIQAIRKCCKFYRNREREPRHFYSSGFKWVYGEDYEAAKSRGKQSLDKFLLDDRRRTITSKPIRQLDAMTGELIQSFKSLSQAAKKTGIALESISRVVNGTRNTAGGYAWREINV